MMARSNSRPEYQFTCPFCGAPPGFTCHYKKHPEKWITAHKARIDLLKGVKDDVQEN